MAELWEVQENLDPHTGEITRVYSYNGQPCKRALLDSKLARHMAGYVLIEKDLRNVETWLREIEARNTSEATRSGTTHIRSTDRERYNLIKGLFVAALTFYGKCFTKCEGRLVKLERAQLDQHFHNVHNECISYRHNFAAHSGAAKLEEAQIALVIPETGVDEVLIYRELWQPDLLWSEDEETSFSALVAHVQAIVRAKLDKLGAKIMSEEIVPKGPQYWRDLND